MSMSWIKKSLFLLIGWALPLTVILIAFELIFGTWLRNDPWTAAESLNIIRNRTILYDVKDLGYQDKAVVYTRDRFGLRGSCQDLTSAKIVTVGGSTTDERYISEGQTWQDVLQEKIRSKLHSDSFCIANAGVDGHSTFGHIQSFRYWFPLIDGLKPDYYLLYVGLNDAGFRFEQNRSYDSRDDTSMSGGFKESIRRNSAIYRLVKLGQSQLETRKTAYAGHNKVVKSRELYKSNRTTDGVEELIQENTKRFEDRLRIILHQIEDRGAKVICVSQPNTLAWDFGDGPRGIESAFEYKGKKYNGLDFRASILSINRSMETLCKKSGGYYIDLASEPFAIDDFYDFTHMTPDAEKKVAEYLFRNLVSLGLVQ